MSSRLTVPWILEPWECRRHTTDRGQHSLSIAESSRSPESWPAEPTCPNCVARPALSEHRGVLAESGVLARGVHVPELGDQCKDSMRFSRRTLD